VAAIGATSGSLSALLLRLLTEGIGAPLGANTFPDCPICSECTLSDLLSSPAWERIDLISLALGILVGLALGPLLDLCFLARQAWRAWIKASLSTVAKRHESESLYRFA
jgi:hypothetical protein